MDRDAFFAQIRQQLGERDDMAPLAVDDATVRRTADVSADTFEANAVTAGMTVTRTTPGDLDELLAGRRAGRRVHADAPDFEADFGVVEAKAGVCETGSLILAGRATTHLLPVDIVVVLREPDLVADLLDAAPVVSALTAEFDYVTTITGPSKTADIEGVLVTGVHGPATVEIVLVGS